MNLTYTKKIELSQCYNLSHLPYLYKYPQSTNRKSYSNKL